MSIFLHVYAFVICMYMCLLVYMIVECGLLKHSPGPFIGS